MSALGRPLDDGDRDPHDYAQAAQRGPAELHSATDQPGALPNPDQSQMIGREQRRGRRERFEATTIIADGELELIRPEAQRDRRTGRVGVPLDIAQRLLADPQERKLHVGLKSPGRAGQGDLDLEPCTLGCGGRFGLDGCCDAEVVEDRRPEVSADASQFLGDGLVNNPALGLATNGTGFAAVFDPKIGLTLRVGVQQSNPDAMNLSDSIYSLAEVGYLATPFGLPEGNYRVWYRATNTAGAGSTALGLSLDQKITPIVTLFGRYGNGRLPANEAGQTSFSLGHHFYSAGVQFQTGWVFNPWDSWGVGYAQTELADSSRERLTEGYYNFRLTERLRLAFHLQHIFESRPDAPSFGYLVPGVRLQATF